MATFIVRVQLSNEQHSQYVLLKNGLTAIGFTKKIKANDGLEYILPNGNYLINSNYDKQTLLNAVKDVAMRIDKSPQILIVESVEKGCMWFGLKQV